jgi:squalene-hopene/tetraprenyl-beta-curcumene cyclase
LSLIFVVAVALAMPAAAEAAAKSAAGDAQAFQQAVDRAIGFLQIKAQAPDGSYAAASGPGVTAVVAAAILHNGRSPDDPVVSKSLKYLEKFVQPDGGVYRPETFYRNYETSLALVCFAAANRDGRYAKLIKSADHFLKSIQWGEEQGYDQSNFSYGGAGYGKSKRPDLSNTSFLMDALRAAGDGPDDPAVKRALVFISRCQNLEGPGNTTGFAAKNPDGGFYYSAASGGLSEAGKTPSGGLRSYGSMTYSGLKSMIYAGVGPDDPRVKAAFAWIQKYYDLKSNPGMGSNGLYYYYQVFGKALDAMGVVQVADAGGAKHDWRRELRDELIRRQQPNGSWVNDNPRWLEGEPSLVTGYALLSLSYCRPDAAKKGK